MELYLVRHAIAEDPPPGGADAERALTAEGRARFERSVLGLRRLGLAADHGWHSPWRRAAQTAQLLRPVLRSDSSVEPLLATAPGQALAGRLVEASSSGGSLALVGHEPWLGELAAWLCFRDRAAAAGLAVRKGGVLWLRGTPSAGGMTLEAVLKPSLLRRVGELVVAPGDEPRPGAGPVDLAD